MPNSTMDAPSGHLYQLEVSGPLHEGFRVHWRDPASSRVTDDVFVYVDIDNTDGLIDLSRFSAPHIAKTMQKAQALVDLIGKMWRDDSTQVVVARCAGELEAMLQEYRMGYHTLRADLLEMLVEDELVELKAIGPEDSEYFATERLRELAST